MMAAVNSLFAPKTTTSSLSFGGVEIAHELDGDTSVAMELSEGRVTGGGEPAGRTTINSALAWGELACCTRSLGSGGSTENLGTQSDQVVTGHGFLVSA